MLLTAMSLGDGVRIFSICMLTICLYFILSYFEYLKEGDQRLIKQTKLLATISLFLGLVVPALYEIF